MTNCWRTIECGIRMGQTWPYAYHYFLSSPSFTDDAICLMLKSMVEHARHLMRWPRSGNWLTMEANGMYHVGVLFPERLGTQLHSLYLTWSPYHYAAQAYGLAVMYCYRSGRNRVSNRHCPGPGRSSG